MKTRSLIYYLLLTIMLALSVSGSLQAQEISVFELIENSSVGLTMVPFERAGLCLVDIDNNGWADIFIPRYKSPGYSRIFINQSGHFTDITAQSPFQQIEEQEVRTFTVVWADYDNDGDKDCSFSTDVGIHLLRNDNNVFTEVSEEMGFVGHKPPGFIVEWHYNIGGWADYDLDGDLDCIVYQQNNTSLYLFRNDGDHFTNVASEAKLDSTRLTMDYDWLNWVSWTDFDLDGDPDLFGMCEFFENRNGVFYDVTDSLGFDLEYVDNREFFDYDNDGDLDFFKATPSGTEPGFDELWENQDGHFVNISPYVGLASMQFTHRGLTIGDFDNDGDQDIFLENSNGAQACDVFLLNDELEGGGRAFADIAEFIGLTEIADRKGCGFFDYDKDGFLDIYMPSAELFHILYHNAASNNTNWIGFILEGTVSNRDAIGSIVQLYYAGKQQLRFTKAGSGWIRQDNPWVHFGLGFETNIDSVVIQWPLGQKQILTDLAINQYHNIKEPDGTKVENNNGNGTKPFTFQLEQNYPNPFNSNTKINYNLTETSNTSLEIYDINGRKIKTLVNQTQNSGYYSVTWDGCDQFGNTVPSGIYISRLVSGQVIQSRKMLHVK